MRRMRHAAGFGTLLAVIVMPVTGHAGESENGSVGAGLVTYDGKHVNLSPARTKMTRLWPPLPQKRPVSLPGREQADAAISGRVERMAVPSAPEGKEAPETERIAGGRSRLVLRKPVTADARAPKGGLLSFMLTHAAKDGDMNGKVPDSADRNKEAGTTGNDRRIVKNFRAKH